MGSIRVSGLRAAFTGLLAPGEVSDRDDEEGVAAVGNTSQGIVPGEESGEETKDTTGLDERARWGCAVILQVTNAKQKEGKVEREEETEEGDGRAQCAHE